MTQKTYYYDGWGTFTIKQSFEVEADSQKEADEKIWEQENSYEIQGRWLDYTTNKIKGSHDVDFFREDDGVETPVYDDQ